jgi:hypothetical protein
MDTTTLLFIIVALFTLIVTVGGVVSAVMISKLKQQVKIAIDPPDKEESDIAVDRVVDPESEVYKDSPTPWVKMIGDAIPDQKGGFKISLDWNKAFVESLKEAGYNGIDDNQMVQKWLAQTALNVAKDMDEQSFGNMLTEPEVDLDDPDEWTTT